MPDMLNKGGRPRGARDKFPRKPRVDKKPPVASPAPDAAGPALLPEAVLSEAPLSLTPEQVKAAEPPPRPPRTLGDIAERPAAKTGEGASPSPSPILPPAAVKPPDEKRLDAATVHGTASVVVDVFFALLRAGARALKREYKPTRRERDGLKACTARYVETLYLTPLNALIVASGAVGGRWLVAVWGGKRRAVGEDLNAPKVAVSGAPAGSGDSPEEKWRRHLEEQKKAGL